MEKLQKWFNNFWSSILIYVITGGILGGLIDLLLFRAYEISKNETTMSFIHGSAVFIGFVSLSLKNHLNEDRRFLLDWIAVVAPGAVLIAEISK